jgi:hypothetical protein
MPKKKVIRTRVWTVTCPKCNTEMYSRSPHDYRDCGCPFGTMVDGGFAEYIRYGGQDLSLVKSSFHYRFVKATRQELYDDWNLGRDKFGIIPKKGAK